MSLNDPLGDMLTRIRNAQMRGHRVVRTPASKLRGWVLEVLLKEGYIRGFERIENDGKPLFEIGLKYYEGQPVIRELKRYSKPGRRAYSGCDELPQVRNGLGVAIVSTSKGVMTDTDARENNVGGEVLCLVF